jgi:hypothetical protein
MKYIILLFAFSFNIFANQNKIEKIIKNIENELYLIKLADTCISIEEKIFFSINKSVLEVAIQEESIKLKFKIKDKINLIKDEKFKKISKCIAHSYFKIKKEDKVVCSIYFEDEIFYKKTYLRY